MINEFISKISLYTSLDKKIVDEICFTISSCIILTAFETQDNKELNFYYSIPAIGKLKFNMNSTDIEFEPSAILLNRIVLSAYNQNNDKNVFFMMKKK